jgi:hypothetical protein
VVTKSGGTQLFMCTRLPRSNAHKLIDITFCLYTAGTGIPALARATSDTILLGDPSGSTQRSSPLPSPLTNTRSVTLTNASKMVCR